MNRHEEICAWLSGRLHGGNSSAELQFLNTRRIAEELENPQDAVPVVHIAGTNGKGSVAACTASICRAAGLKTGLFTSPHLKRFNERIAINGKAISNSEFDELATGVDRLCTGRNIRLSGFAVLALMAFVYFRRHRCDIAIIETGLGGRLDATNIASKPLCSVITAIDYDHTQILGDTLQQIAAEKCGIIKPGSPVAALLQDEQVNGVIRDSAALAGSKLVTVDENDLRFCFSTLRRQRFDFAGYKALEIGLPGKHQLRNAALAVRVAETLAAAGLPVSETDVRNGLRVVRWPGRLDIIRYGQKTVLIDGAHNPQGARALAEFVREKFTGRVAVVFAGLRSKDTAAVIGELAGITDKAWVTEVCSPLSLPPETLVRHFEEQGIAAVPVTPLEQAIRQALSEYETVVVCGTLYMIAGARAALRKITAEGTK